MREVEENILSAAVRMQGEDLGADTLAGLRPRNSLKLPATSNNYVKLTSDKLDTDLRKSINSQRISHTSSDRIKAKARKGRVGVSRQALNYVVYDGKSHIKSDPSAPVVLVKGKSCGCSFIITDDNVLHISLNKNGMPYLAYHQWCTLLDYQEDISLYNAYLRNPDFDWYQIQHVDTSRVDVLIKRCKEMAHLNIKGRRRKSRKGDPIG